MYNTDLKRKLLLAIGMLLLSALVAAADDNVPASIANDPAAIIQKYVAATSSDRSSLRNASMEVDIHASIPKLKERGRLHALRTISKLGLSTYRVLAFQGDNTVKNQVIARYLQAEQQGQGDSKLAITPENYNFKYKGEQNHDIVGNVYVFRLSPRKKRIGLFKGEMWLDPKTYLPLLQRGRFVKNPSIWFKRVDFERVYAVRNGVTIPQYVTSTIDTRLIGKVFLDINYSNVEQHQGSNDQVGSLGNDPAAESVTLTKR